MEGSNGTCIACGMQEVALNAEQKCEKCGGAAPAATPEAAPATEAPTMEAPAASEGEDAPAEGGEMAA